MKSINFLETISYNEYHKARIWFLGTGILILISFAFIVFITVRQWLVLKNIHIIPKHNREIPKSPLDNQLATQIDLMQHQEDSLRTFCTRINQTLTLFKTFHSLIPNNCALQNFQLDDSVLQVTLTIPSSTILNTLLEAFNDSPALSNIMVTQIAPRTTGLQLCMRATITQNTD